MSLSPMFSEIWFPRPSRLLHQHFGDDLAPEDIWAPLIIPTGQRSIWNWPNYYRLWKTGTSEQDAGSTMKIDKDKFQVNLDVQQFSPKEISIKASGDNQIIIEGKHGEREDEHGYISRHFVRRYILPEGVDINKVESKLSSDGILTITAPKFEKDTEPQRTIPIVQTGQPSNVKEEVKNLEKGDTN